ncbi:DUF2271 domain-containing protein [Marinomonas ostreistagni]|uniref:DUF2271 domain-containing protein n=1 Tax=Marinomonas ostreistagni TaxID=359209 RepID=UPI00194F77D0|nr:DUF2271 domain-containing protein [Marinomonas ostreistagni]MBM6550966.1 DUF2271 domain-containing protein [Marinomonas ostreistagni]
MRSLINKTLLGAALGMASLAQAATVEVAFEIPRPDAERYAKPYVAIWAEQGRDSEHLLVWHLQGEKDKWLSDLRRWWRKVGRYDHHIDGLTGATKGPGHYSETFNVNDDWDKFTLYVEAARENGGRSLVKAKIDLNDGQSQYRIPAEDELGDILITVK